VPTVSVPRVTDAPPTDIPTGLLVTVVAVPLTISGEEAVILVAPAELRLAAFTVIEATPLALVNAVAEVGVKETSPLSAEKVTTTPCMAVPLAFLTVAVAVTGVPYVTLETFKVIVGDVVVVPEPVLVSALLPQAVIKQNRMKEISSNNNCGNFTLINFAILLSLFLRLKTMLL
jgi:hypothetical protein